MKLTNLAKYRFTEDDQRTFQEEGFRKVHGDIKLNDIKAADTKTLAAAEGAPGVYFWVLLLKDEWYKIYIGKTKSLVRRLSDYTNPFQVHSPNDYKLRFFHEFILGHATDAKLALFFKPCSLADYTDVETRLVSAFSPLINARSRAQGDERELMKAAFTKYYKAIFERELGVAPN